MPRWHTRASGPGQKVLPGSLFLFPGDHNPEKDHANEVADKNEQIQRGEGYITHRIRAGSVLTIYTEDIPAGLNRFFLEIVIHGFQFFGGAGGL